MVVPFGKHTWKFGHTCFPWEVSIRISGLNEDYDEGYMLCGKL